MLHEDWLDFQDNQIALFYVYFSKNVIEMFKWFVFLGNQTYDIFSDCPIKE